VAVITVKKAVADNIRAYRQLRGLDQDELARRMSSVGVGIQWRRVTVSEVERDQRNVTVPELLWLALALDTTVERLLDPRGPERLKGPELYLTLLPAPELPEEEAAALGREKRLDVGEYRIQAISPEDLTALVCGHEARAVAEWDDVTGSLKSLHYEHQEQPK
jgi:transcriptional regulator with XRE-family HTH domain